MRLHAHVHTRRITRLVVRVEQIEPMKPEEEENKLEPFEGNGMLLFLLPAPKPAFLRSYPLLPSSLLVCVCARARARTRR